MLTADYYPKARQIAKHFRAPGHCDNLANDRDDYVQEMAIVGMKAQQTFRKRYQGNPDRYVYKALWNMGRRLSRRGMGGEIRVELCYAMKVPGLDDLSNQLSAKNALVLLQRRLPSDEWRDLLRVGLGGVSNSYGAGDGSHARWTQRICRLRRKARKILSGNRAW